MHARLPLGGRLSVSPIITQIGRENNISAENYVSRTVEDAGPYNLVNILMRRSPKGHSAFYGVDDGIRFSRELRYLNHGEAVHGIRNLLRYGISPKASMESRTKGNEKNSLAADAIRGRAAMPYNAKGVDSIPSPSVLDKKSDRRLPVVFLWGG